MLPHLASHELALELDDPRRVHGLALLLQLVRGSHPEAWASPAQREQFLRQVRPHLTASEQVCPRIPRTSNCASNCVMRFLCSLPHLLISCAQVQVFEAAPPTDPSTAEASYDAALAYISTGFTTNNPAYILRAEKLLSGLQDSSAG